MYSTNHKQLVIHSRVLQLLSFLIRITGHDELYHKAGFTMQDTLPSLLDCPRICQCKLSGATSEAESFPLVRKFFSIQHCPSRERL